MVDGERFRSSLGAEAGLRARGGAAGKCRRMHIDCTGMAGKASRAGGSIWRTGGPKSFKFD